MRVHELAVHVAQAGGGRVGQAGELHRGEAAREHGQAVACGVAAQFYQHIQLVGQHQGFQLHVAEQAHVKEVVSGSFEGLGLRVVGQLGVVLAVDENFKAGLVVVFNQGAREITYRMLAKVCAPVGQPYLAGTVFGGRLRQLAQRFERSGGR